MAPEVEGDGLLPWLAILGAALCFGTFTVPMKWPSVVEAQVHPMVYQSYKTLWNFVSVHAMLLFLPYEFTYWGLLSGFLWVPAGMAAVFAVQNAGIARAPAIWQVTIIVTTFAWSYFALQDILVRSMFGTVVSLILLITGVVGMTLSFGAGAKLSRSPSIRGAAQYEPVQEDEDDGDAPSRFDSAQQFDRLPLPKSTRNVGASFRGMTAMFRRLGSGISEAATAAVSEETEHGENLDSVLEAAVASGPASQRSVALGIVAALFNGIWGGTNLVPSHYAPLHGVHFAISFATGALVANATIVIVYALFARYYWHCALPSPKFRAMLVPGLVSGLLWSLGNFLSLYVVSSLGQGIGYSLVQSSVIVSGLWGILYYRELVGKRVRKWAKFCFVCLLGILGLALMRQPA